MLGLTLALLLTAPPVFEITGADASTPEACLRAIDLPPGAQADAATARLVEGQLAAFLRAEGYDLATVRAFPARGAIRVEIDEGKIDRILFLDRLTWQQIRFKLAIALPHGAFNRKVLDRQVAALSEKLGTPGVRWEFVRVAPVDHEGPQLVPAPPPWEVRVLLPAAPSQELWLDVRAYYVDGLELELSHVHEGMLLAGDRFRAAASAGVGIRKHVDTRAFFPFFSRAAAGVQYGFPGLGGVLRPTVWLGTELVNRHRPDLWLETYWAFAADASTGLELELRRGLRFTAAFGIQDRLLFGAEAAPGGTSPFEGEVREQVRPFARATAELVADPAVRRWDRRHALELEGRWYFPLGAERTLAWADLRYQFVQELGWHDFWVKARGHTAYGDVTFHDEISVGEFARGISVDQFVHHGASLLIEFRYSLVRDVVKVGVFHDVALIAVPKRAWGEGLTAELAHGAGPSVHVLFFDFFQLDTYLGFGLRETGRVHLGVSLMLNKVF